MPTAYKNTQLHSSSDKYISLEDYLRFFVKTDDGIKHEWVDGEIEQITGITQRNAVITNRLMRVFFKTQFFKDGGMFIVSGNMGTIKNVVRIPDIAIYTADQEKSMINGENQVAPWVGEIISEKDKVNHTIKKIQEYFTAGVKKVWLIFPELEKIYMYESPDEVIISQGKNICSLKPILNDFEITAENIFA